MRSARMQLHRADGVVDHQLHIRLRSSKQKKKTQTFILFTHVEIIYIIHILHKKTQTAKNGTKLIIYSCIHKVAVDELRAVLRDFERVVS